MILFAISLMQRTGNINFLASEKIDRTVKRENERQYLRVSGVQAELLVYPYGQAGDAWKPDSLTQAFWRAAKKLGIKKRLNDLRGTAITRFVLADLTDEQVADIVGWDLNRIRNIRKHYVDPNRIAMGLISKLEKAERTG